jgi:hypothetical protein
MGRMGEKNLYLRHTRVIAAETTVQDAKMRRRVQRRAVEFQSRTGRLLEELKSNVERGLYSLELLCQGGNPSHDYLSRVGMVLAKTGTPMAMVRAMTAMKMQRYYHAELWAAAAAVIQEDKPTKTRNMILKVVKAHVDLKLEKESKDLLKFAAEKFLPMIREMEEDHYPDFSMLLTLLSDANVRHDRYVREMANHFASRPKATPEEVATLCRALGTFRLKVRPAINHAADLLERDWTRYKFSQAQEVLHIYAVFFVVNHSMCAVAAKVLRNLASKAKPSEVTAVVKDFAELRFRDDAFLSKICEPLLDYRIVEYSNEELSSIAFCLGKLDYYDYNVIECLSLQLEPKVKELRGRPLSRALQGLELLGAPARSAAEAVLEASLSEEQDESVESPRCLDDYEKSVLALSANGGDTFEEIRPTTAPERFSVELPRIRALDARPLTSGSPSRPARFVAEYRTSPPGMGFGPL